MTGRNLIICLLALLPLGAQGKDYQALDSIRQAARSFVLSQAQPAQGRVQVTIGALDRRLHLPHCGQALDAFLPPGGRLQGNTTIGVRCTNGKPWKLYVPARIAVIDRVLIARHHLPKGSRIQDDDLEYSEFDLATLNSGYFTDKRRLMGKVLKQSILAGRVIKPRIIDKPKLVQRGQGVTILAVSGGFEIRMKGKALMDGSAGELIKVKNVKSRRIVEGEVVAPGLIKVRL
ncbi:MAG: flagellar basal body P-ring formation chaperone FlgA [Gammaproteobacteria bacterium]